MSRWSRGFQVTFKFHATFAALLMILSMSFRAQAQQNPQDQPVPTPAPFLKSYTIEPGGISISGVSSGGFMAVQMQVAYSSLFSGAGSIAGGIYGCSAGDLEQAKTDCTIHPERIDSRVQIQQAQKWAALGLIDPLDHLQRHQIYLFASPKDLIIKPQGSEKLLEFYQAFRETSQIQFEQSLESAHGFPTLDAGAPCKVMSLPWILKCDFDTAGAVLQKMYGPLKPRTLSSVDRLYTFSQEEFGDAATPLYPTGWVYVPKDCEQGLSCRLHVALHGCQMNPNFIQDQFASLAGYNEWAEANRIIVLYPQSGKIIKENPYACWDWFGFTGVNYAQKSGAQMQALYKMIQRLRGL